MVSRWRAALVGPFDALRLRHTASKWLTKRANFPIRKLSLSQICSTRVWRERENTRYCVSQLLTAVEQFHGRRNDETPPRRGFTGWAGACNTSSLGLGEFCFRRRDSRPGKLILRGKPPAVKPPASSRYLPPTLGYHDALGLGEYSCWSRDLFTAAGIAG